ncbi:D-lactate dehydrogenase [Brevundimonas sp. SL161]|uniref:D-lactate dehydrogenase n=1 Tax=Brevundimonas sp. SL161 TaxID=2804613 RepID=UPI003CE67B91
MDGGFLASLRTIVGGQHVLTTPARTAPFRRGYRFGGGKVLAVARPGTLIEQWRVLKACAAAGKIILMQAANTGLTGGSTPDGDDYDRDIVIVSTLRITTVHLIEDGRQVICLPGSTLSQLERLLSPLGREPHSVIGSSCIGASVVGGVCNNSGGSLIQRGPAFTRLALFARIDESGDVELINHLGVALGNDAEDVLNRLERGEFTQADISHDPMEVASDHDYAQRVRHIDADSPARFNADPDRLFEVSGSAGKVMVFAVRLDTFEKSKETATFYIGASDPATLTRIRRDILGGFTTLPVAAEYMHRDCYDIARTYGKDAFLAIKHFGTDSMQRIFALKATLDSIAGSLPLVPAFAIDRLAQLVGGLFPEHLPERMNAYRDCYEHHLMLKMTGAGVDEARRYFLEAFIAGDSAWFECTEDESVKAFLHRFVAAGAAVRYRAIHHREVSDIVALDIALRRNERDWFEVLPPDMSAAIKHSLYYGHFFCHVFHQDYIVVAGEDPVALEHRMLAVLDQRGAKYPAEHNVGHLYEAGPAQTRHFRKLDPCNCFNPGIGRTSRKAEWV